MYNIFSNSNLFVGKGSRSNLANLLEKLEVKKVLLVIGKNSKEHGIQDMIFPYIDENKYQVRMFNNIKPNPTILNVKDGVDVAREFKPEIIIAVGGGSVIDTAKAIDLALANPNMELTKMNGLVNSEYPCTPIVALPTTAGTGTEVTPYFVITNEEGRTKMCCVNSDTFPMYAIVDIDLMEGMPRGLAAATGMDALTHAFEAGVNTTKNDLSMMYALQAIKVITQNIYNAVIDKDEHAREQMALGSYMAGYAFCNSGLGITHSMAHQLGGMYDMPHGEANAILLPEVVRLNGNKVEGIYTDLARAMGLDPEGKANSDVIEMIATSIESLNVRLGVTKKLRDYGVEEANFERLALQAMGDVTYETNPYHATKDDLMNILRKLY